MGGADHLVLGIFCPTKDAISKLAEAVLDAEGGRDRSLPS